MRDEAYIIDLCDEVLGMRAERQRTFGFLRGDGNPGRKLPVDAYYLELQLVIEYRERQHTEQVDFWDRKPTKSGVPRGVQRRLYDERRREVLPRHGITLVELSYADFQHQPNKRLRRDTDIDRDVIRERLREWLLAAEVERS